MVSVEAAANHRPLRDPADLPHVRVRLLQSRLEHEPDVIVEGLLDADLALASAADIALGRALWAVIDPSGTEEHLDGLPAQVRQGDASLADPPQEEVAPAEVGRLQ